VARAQIASIKSAGLQLLAIYNSRISYSTSNDLHYSKKQLTNFMDMSPS